ncbi:MAG: glutamate synthase subunit beta [Myxococcales bacterium]|nr:glutamate synthase subunit beta [Myxococcales bacterium]
MSGGGNGSGSGSGNGWAFVSEGRRGPAARAVDERLGDWREVYRGDEETADLRAQASRCMDCGVPFCHQGCPLGNPIPDFNDSLRRGAWRRAYEQLSATNNFPEFTGRLCPAPCEGACVLGIGGDDGLGAEHPSLGRPVTIEHIERHIIERAFAEGWVEPCAPKTRSDKHVAVVGSGPAGLAAAAQLCSAGHRVTIFEAADRAGGLLRYGIPDFKLEKQVLDRRLALMRQAGVEIVCGVRAGEHEGWDALRARHDALLIATGAERARELDVPGARELDGVTLAMPYLTQQNRLVAGAELGPGERRIDAHAKRVVILGGGDTGSDCLGTALRQGAASVQQIELLPQPPATRAASNPWPRWPLIFRTSSSQAEGGARDFGVLTKRLVGDDAGNLVALEAVRVTLDDGQLQEIEGADPLRIDVDLLILALGFLGPRSEALVEQLGVALDARGNVAVDAHYATNVDGVFCAGDAHRGASLIVWAIAEGREAARGVDRYLRRGKPSRLPTRGRDDSFEPSRRR